MHDDDLPQLANAALAGIHHPQEMPFLAPWTHARPEELPANLARFHWANRAKLTPRSWNLDFVVRRDGEVLGIQKLSATDFSEVRSVASGSWLTQKQQGQGLGKEMRSAILLFAFDYLGASQATTAALWDNRASRAVSESLGYRANGEKRLPLPANQEESQGPRSYRVEKHYVLDPGDFRRPSWQLEVGGFTAGVKRQLGISGGSDPTEAD